MAIDWGFDFRGTLGFVTDPANCSFDSGLNYPNVYGNGATAGWDFGVTATVAYQNDGDNAIDPRLAGVVGNANAPAQIQTFRIDLPSTGLYNIILAMGDHNYQRTNQTWNLYDNVTLFDTLSAGDTVAGHRYFDATHTLSTSAADWATNGSIATLQRSFASTIFNVVIGDGTNFTLINHLRITTVAGGVTLTGQASTSATGAPGNTHTIAL